MKTIRTSFPLKLVTCLLPALSTLAACAAIGPEGNEWRLVDMPVAQVSQLPANTQPTLKFDSVHTKAAGFAGCNNYFSQYQLDGASLKFGPVAATRRACPDTESKVEQHFLAALEKTRAWQIKDGQLLLLNAAEVLARFVADKPEETKPDLESFTVRSSVYTATAVKLTRGEFRTPAAPGAASAIVVKLTDTHAFATMNGQAKGAVVLVTETGGTGTFYELALLSRGKQGWVNTDTILLGDRVKVHSVTIQDEHIMVAMNIHTPTDPQCCPTRAVTRQFTVRDDRLVAVIAGTQAQQPQLAGTRWQWAQTRYNNDTLVTPAKPENYTLEFLAEGKLAIKADCNLKSGTYTTNGKQLSLTVLTSTMAACEPGSLEDEYVRNLGAGVIFFFRDGNLYLDLKYDSGTMKFVRSR